MNAKTPPWLRYLQEHLTIYCENTRSINISKNPVQHSRTKHIKIRHHFIRKLVENGTLTLEFVHTDDQKADLFTKPFDSKWFEFLHQNIGVISMDWFPLLLLLPHPVASSFMHCFVCLFFNMQRKIKRKKNQNALYMIASVFSRRCRSYRMYIEGDSPHRTVMIVCELKWFSHISNCHNM